MYISLNGRLTTLPRPDMSVEDLLRHLRANTPQTTVVVNNNLLSEGKFESHRLKSGDNVTITPLVSGL